MFSTSVGTVCPAIKAAHLEFTTRGLGPPRSVPEHRMWVPQFVTSGEAPRGEADRARQEPAGRLGCNEHTLATRS